MPVHLVTVTTSSTGRVRTGKGGREEGSWGKPLWSLSLYYFIATAACSVKQDEPMRRSVGWRVEVFNTYTFLLTH